jgi:hypothetical protein
LTVSTRIGKTTMTLLVALLCSSPRIVCADYLFTPFVGGAFAGSTAFPNLDQGAGATQLIFGGSGGWLGAGVLGVEGDFAWAPGFFERDTDLPTILDSNVFTLSGNVIIAVPLSVTEYSLRPYAIGGMGLIHSGITYLAEVIDPVDDNSLGFNIGAGAMGFFSRNTGIRFEVRHFRTFERETNLMGDLQARLSFWRATVGVVIRR